MVEITTTGTIEYAAKKASFALTRIGTGEIKAELWGCGECGTIYTSEETAAGCCACQRCGKADKNGGRYAKHAECKRLDEAERDAVWAGERAVKDARVLLAATPVDAGSYTDPVYWNDRVITDADDIEAELECSDSYEDGLPSFVFGTTPHALNIDADSALETALEQGDMDEEAGDRVGTEAKEALAKSIAAWNDTYGSTVTSYSEDSSVVVVLDHTGFDEELEAAHLLLAEHKVAKLLVVALYLLTSRESVQDFIWSRKPWIQSGWWKDAS